MPNWWGSYHKCVCGQNVTVPGTYHEFFERYQTALPAAAKAVSSQVYSVFRWSNMDTHGVSGIDKLYEERGPVVLCYVSSEQKLVINTFHNGRCFQSIVNALQAKGENYVGGMPLRLANTIVPTLLKVLKLAKQIVALDLPETKAPAFAQRQVAETPAGQAAAVSSGAAATEQTLLLANSGDANQGSTSRTHTIVGTMGESSTDDYPNLEMTKTVARSFTSWRQEGGVSGAIMKRVGVPRLVVMINVITILSLIGLVIAQRYFNILGGKPAERPVGPGQQPFNMTAPAGYSPGELPQDCSEPLELATYLTNMLGNFSLPDMTMGDMFAVHGRGAIPGVQPTQFAEGWSFWESCNLPPNIVGLLRSTVSTDSIKAIIAALHAR